MQYLYRCEQEKCTHEFYAYHSMKQDFLKKCPQCEQNSLAPVIHAAKVFVKGEPQTIGAIAEQNNQRLGRMGCEDMWAMQEERKQIAKFHAREALANKLPIGASLPDLPKSKEMWYRPGLDQPNMGLADLSVGQQKKFIEEGKVE